MLLDSHAPGIAAEVSTAFLALAKAQPGIVRRFEDTFRQRAQMAGVAESNPGYRGIEGALAELFPSIFRVESPEDIGHGLPPDRAFIEEARRAIELMADEDPLSLLLLKRHQIDQNCTLEQALQSLFLNYSRRATAYPY